MNNQALSEFVAAARAKGLADATVVDLLRQEGWPDGAIFGAVREYYERETGLQVPVRRVSKERAKDAFLYLLNFVTLGIWTIGLGQVWFQIIELYNPDPLERMALYYRQALSSSVASVVVAFPVFLFAARLIMRDVTADAAKLESPVRKWLTYLALLVAASVVIGDLITALSYTLRGDLTLRFVLKVLVVLVIAGGVFGFYLASMMKRLAETQRKLVRPFLAVGVAAVVATFGMGFHELGTPAYQRSLRADRQRVQHLNRIANELARQWAAAKGESPSLPRDLTRLGRGGLQTAGSDFRRPV